MAQQRTVAKKIRLIEALVQTPIVESACKKAGVSRATYYRYIDEDEDFKYASEHALHISTGRVSDMAESKLIQNIQSGDQRSIEFFLKRRNSNYSGKDPGVDSRFTDGKSFSLAVMKFLGFYDSDPNKKNKYWPKG